MSALTPSPLAVARGQRIRRVWAELSRAQAAGEVPPSMRELARRCRLPSCSTAQTCVSTLIALGAVEAVAVHPEPTARGERRRVTSALRVAKLYGWESYE